MSHIETAILRSSTTELRLLNLGCITQSWTRADWDQSRSAVLGYADAQAYKNNPHYLGAIVGRVSNRIANGSFMLNGARHRLNANEPPNTLHGGAGGLSQRIWQMECDAEQSVQFQLTSEQGDQGFPGRAHFTVTISLSGDEVLYDMQAEVSEPTPISMTQHNYYNLSGQGNVEGHRLCLPADHVLGSDDAGLPTDLKPVHDSAYDFRTPRTLRTDSDLALDSHFCLDQTAQTRVSLIKASTELTMTTHQPGLQIYTGGKLSQTHDTFGAQTHGPFSGICLEPQGYPNAVNRPDFPTMIVTPDAPYHHRLSVKISEGVSS